MRHLIRGPGVVLGLVTPFERALDPNKISDLGADFGIIVR